MSRISAKEFANFGRRYDFQKTGGNNMGFAEAVCIVFAAKLSEAYQKEIKMLGSRQAVINFLKAKSLLAAPVGPLPKGEPK